ncbi:glycosyl transferase family 1 [Mycobacterium sp. 852013-51886_SCH5428379]|nr:glycosyltransferase [Mycobacterium sp. 852013-51886_SCH5428379]OBB60066.1 glycosyl transferase family 1 [Mycobacterium sp. 852013-51886_SCH5428379]
MPNPTVGVLSTYAPTFCGIASFSAALAGGLRGLGTDVGIVRVADDVASTGDGIVGEVVSGSAPSLAACAEMLNRHDVAIIQHEYGIYGGRDGDEVLDIMGGLRVPSVVVAHTVLKNPTARQRAVMEEVAAKSDQIVVMSESAHRVLRSSFHVDDAKISVIPHGATMPCGESPKRSGRPIVLTWGLIGPGKGIERVIDAMPALVDIPGRPKYVVAGRTHPKVLAAEGESYREALLDRARRNGVADSVDLEDGYRSTASRTALIRSAAVIALPYDSTDQATSGVLVDAVAGGRPIVATAFPHAVELLSTGAGIVVDHDDPAAMASALRRVLTQPRLAGDMAGAARQLAPTMAWPVVAEDYLRLAKRVISARPALV